MFNFYSNFVRYNRVLFVVTGKIYQENDLNQPSLTVVPKRAT